VFPLRTQHDRSRVDVGVDIKKRVGEVSNQIMVKKIVRRALDFAHSHMVLE
jgi:hypothetical protein